MLSRILACCLLSALASSCGDERDEVVEAVDASNPDSISTSRKASGCIRSSETIEVDLNVHSVYVKMLHSSGKTMHGLLAGKLPGKIFDSFEDYLIRVALLSVVNELNVVWAQAKIHWRISSMKDLSLEHPLGDEAEELAESITQEGGRPPEYTGPGDWLYSLAMISSPARPISESAANLFILPFVGNKLQGVTMNRPFIKGTNLGTIATASLYSNEGIDADEQPFQRPLTCGLTKAGANDNCGDGTVALTSAHELGHVLGLGHECPSGKRCIMKGDGTLLPDDQILAARVFAAQKYVGKSLCD